MARPFVIFHDRLGHSIPAGGHVAPAKAGHRRDRTFLSIQVRARPREHKEHEDGYSDERQRQQTIERSHK